MLAIRYFPGIIKWHQSTSCNGHTIIVYFIFVIFLFCLKPTIIQIPCSLINVHDSNVNVTANNNVHFNNDKDMQLMNTHACVPAMRTWKYSMEKERYFNIHESIYIWKLNVLNYNWFLKIILWNRNKFLVDKFV